MPQLSCAVKFETFRIRFFVRIATILFGSLSLLASIPAAVAGTNVWTWIGSLGGSLSSIAFDRADPTHLIGQAFGGTYVSIDGGTTWSDVYFEGKRVLKGEVAAGRGRFYVRSDDRKVLVSSNDGGKTWARNAAFPDSLTSLAVDAGNNDVLYALVNDTSGPSGSLAVIKSSDAGVTWIRVAPPAGQGTAYHLVVDPVRAGVLYVGIRGMTPPFVSLYWRSTDGGSTWTTLDPSLPIGGFEYLSIDPNQPGALYITRIADQRRTIYLARSTDGGTTWQTSPTNLPPGSSDTYLIAPDATDYGTLYIGSGTQVLRSMDFGTTWAPMSRPPAVGDITVVADPTRSKRLFALGEGGLFRTDDATSWAAITAGISQVALDAIEIDEPRVMIRTYTNGPRSYALSIDRSDWIKDVAPPAAPIADLSFGMSRSVGNPSWSARRYVAVRASDVRPAGSVAQSSLYVTQDDGATWSAQTISGVDVPNSLIAASDTGTTATPQLIVGSYLVIPCQAVCGATNSIYVASNDGGLSWHKMGTPTGVNSVRSFAIARDGTSSQFPTLFAALATGSIVRSSDGGATFVTVSTAAVGGTLYSDPYRTSGTAVLYSAAAGSTTLPPRFYRSVDGGVTWSEIAFDVALSQTTGAIVDMAFSQTRPERIDAATANGMLMESNDAGATWQIVSLGVGEETAFVQFGRHEPRTAYFGSHAHGVASYTIARDGPVDVVEFYNTTLDHYFVTSSAEEAIGIDRGAAGPGWIRTGVAFRAWLAAEAAPAGAAAVCRFYGTPGKGPNSHFYTVNPGECANVKRDPGWTYEGTAFYVIAPQNDQCPGSAAVYRAYDNRFAQNDSNHRYSTQLSLLQAMTAKGWSVEGVAFCSAN